MERADKGLKQWQWEEKGGDTRKYEYIMETELLSLSNQQHRKKNKCNIQTWLRQGILPLWETL